MRSRILRLQRVAARRHGVVTVDELRACDLDEDAVLRLRRSGDLHRLHQGVDLLGDPPASPRGRYLAALERAPRYPGRSKLHRALPGDGLVLSELESAFLRLLASAGLPLPVTNRLTAGHRVDCTWPARRLVVELASYRYHATRHQWERDLRRAADARAAGFRHLTFTWGDVVERPSTTLAELAGLLTPA